MNFFDTVLELVLSLNRLDTASKEAPAETHERRTEALGDDFFPAGGFEADLPKTKLNSKLGSIQSVV